MVKRSGEVPFRITDINLSFQEAEGSIRYENGRVIIVYLIKDALGLFVKSDVKELYLSLDDLSRLEIKDWWVTMRLTLAVKSTHLLNGLPNGRSEEVTMKIPKKFRDLLHEFVLMTRASLSEHRQKQI